MQEIREMLEKRAQYLQKLNKKKVRGYVQNLKLL